MEHAMGIITKSFPIPMSWISPDAWQVSAILLPTSELGLRSDA